MSERCYHGATSRSYPRASPILHISCQTVKFHLPCHFNKPCVTEIYFIFNLNNEGNVLTGPDGAVAMSSANAKVGTGFASRYRLQLRASF